MFIDKQRRGNFDARLTLLQLKFKLDLTLDWRFGAVGAWNDLRARMVHDEEFGLDVIDFVLVHIQDFTDQYDDSRNLVNEAEELLRLGGSAWEVAVRDWGAFQLSHKAVGPVRDVIESIPSSSRSHQHLVTAWNQLVGRNPNASSAYREAVKAVEAAAKPVILPSNDRATLGLMIAALRDKPSKWVTTVGKVQDLRQLMEAVWKSQWDRHGTDADSAPLSVSQAEADSAFVICLALARLFAGGHVRPATPSPETEVRLG